MAAARATAGRTAVCWLRNDLRVADSATMDHVANTCYDAAVFVYCFHPRTYTESWMGLPRTSGHRARFLLDTLSDLRSALRGLGSDLVVRHGLPAEVIAGLVDELAADVVVYHQAVGSEEADDEAALAAALPDAVTVKSFWGRTLHHRDDLPFALADLPPTFTPFRKALERAHSVPREIIPRPTSLPPLPDAVEPGKLPSLTDLGLERPPADSRAVHGFPGGESGAWARIAEWMWDGDALRRYKETRNGMLGGEYSSKLSPWLALGCISPRQVASEVRRYEAERVANKSTYWLIFELLFADYFTFYAARAGRSLFAARGPADVSNAAWDGSDAAFAAWAAGTTGIPLVDANMRELLATGYMSNRGRQIVASVLTKNMRVDWRRGAAWFEAQLIDHDVALNYGNWAYVAGVGADPRPDRYFNVAKQAATYDPDGAYQATWLPPADRAAPSYPATPIIDLAATYPSARNHPAARRSAPRKGRGRARGRYGRKLQKPNKRTVKRATQRAAQLSD
ncbi:cryptochrome DASH [Thecamonas trahens ATCC 50062]|uniref:Cryptochrome DASH n=1 Tax=Thecamonas trahens ATCC 50062 TaxID=461836 RepID=A0A0L0DU22_THETB|nr:cryptochrome DASH [Thecamonas trahens ATCC 50062]KNC55829.1 cryptochrome DASH [Thecamonas trahens ATCC 50062]|eukprot:XP_013752806.1 cryptochrome DASH [Thecamonas trahens ATCC 50062]